jgi:hypothetical protein
MSMTDEHYRGNVVVVIGLALAVFAAGRKRRKVGMAF